MTSIETSDGGRAALLAAARAELEEHGSTAVGLRAVARRAGLSHAAPGYFFRDRAGMLTALAVDGFDALADRLDAVPESVSPQRLTALGRAYLEFGLEHRALFDLMFQQQALRQEDPELRRAQQRAIAPLAVAGSDSITATVMSWALAHGLVALVREGALNNFDDDPLRLAHDVITRFAEQHLGGRPPEIAGGDRCCSPTAPRAS
jgi:AcrR family transcriptional regulator